MGWRRKKAIYTMLRYFSCTQLDVSADIHISIYWQVIVILAEIKM
jgi:hypothetical protein